MVAVSAIDYISEFGEADTRIILRQEPDTELNVGRINEHLLAATDQANLLYGGILPDSFRFHVLAMVRYTLASASAGACTEDISKRYEQVVKEIKDAALESGSTTATSSASYSTKPRREW